MYTHAIGIELYWPTQKIMYLCEISFAEAKKVLLNIILICIYFQDIYIREYKTSFVYKTSSVGRHICFEYETFSCNNA